MSASKLENPFSSGQLQILLNNFSCNLSVVNDLHRVAEENYGTNQDLTGSMLIAMRRYLDDFDLIHSQIDQLVQLAQQREKGGTK